MNCRVVVEAAVPVYDVETADEAVRIAISKTGEMLNPDLNYVEIDMGERSCPHCEEALEPAFLAADESLVALELEMTVFNVERNEHAARIARKEIGQRLANIPLDVLEIEQIDDESDDTATDESDTEESDTEESDTEESDTKESDTKESDPEEAETEESDTEETESTPSESEVSSQTPQGSDDEVLPEFEELIDE